MSNVVIAPPAAPPPQKRDERFGMPIRSWPPRVLWVVLGLLVFTGIIYLGFRGYHRLTRSSAAEIPVVRVVRGDVQFTITAKGELQGGNPEILAAPMTSGGTLHITFLRKPGNRSRRATSLSSSIPPNSNTN